MWGRFDSCLGHHEKTYKELKVFDTTTMTEPAGSLLQQLRAYEEVSNDSYVSYDLPDRPGRDPILFGPGLQAG